jgi:hypothetical protein
LRFLEHETGLAGGLRPLALAEQSSAANYSEASLPPPHVGKEMLALISLRFSAQGGHIDAFRSIVGEAPEKKELWERWRRGQSSSDIAREVLLFFWRAGHRNPGRIRDA